ncbi:DUF456 domain-containing protein [Candidatus Dojkabacteria bacterium]|nr:DUF456 domain-containing protein [Candidatus Dojkabacteria bacterium]
MPIIQILIYILCAIIILIGCTISLFSLPGGWLIFLGFLITSIVDGFETFSLPLIIIVFIICLSATFIDNIAVLLGAKQCGASKWGMIGAIVGSIVGFFVGNIIGLIIGPLLGAFLFEMIFAQKGWEAALKAGIGTFIGLIVSIITKFVINVGLAFVWFVLIFR